VGRTLDIGKLKYMYTVKEEYVTFYESFHTCTCSNNAPNCDLRCVNFAIPFSKRLGMDRNLSVCPVGAVSNITTEKLSSFTNLRYDKTDIM
jgi:hypothetical protein